MMSQSKLREIVREQYGSYPTYIFSKDGPDDDPQFSASVTFCGLTFQSPGRSRTLREAEKTAAEVAIDALLAKKDEEPTQTNEPARAIQIQSSGMLQPPASLPSTSDSGITNMLATGMLGKRQRTEDLQQSEERISHPQFCPTPGDHKSKLNEFAMTFSFCTPVYSSLCDGLPCRPRFKATVEFDGKTFESPGFFNTLWQAEQAAALAVLDSFSERASTLVKSPICKILLEIKAQKEGSPLPVYNTTFVSSRSVFTSTVKFNGMEFVGKAANNKKQAENNAATVAWSTLKELKGSAVSTLQVPDNKEKAPVCESNDHTLVQVINHLEETRRVGSQGELSHLEPIKSL